jgi:hypothetical protein
MSKEQASESQLERPNDMSNAEDISKAEAGQSDSWTPEEEKKALRKLDWCLIPLLVQTPMIPSQPRLQQAK